MISRNMLIALQDREKFLKNALTPMSFFGVKTALLYVFRNPESMLNTAVASSPKRSSQVKIPQSV